MRAENPLDGIDSRVVLWGYCVVVTAVGLFITLWGRAWVGGPLDDVPWGLPSLVRMVGVVIAGAGLVAGGLARVTDPASRLSALRWFLAAHALALLVAFTQWFAIWRTGPLDWVLHVLAAATMLLFYTLIRAGGDPVFAHSRLLGDRPADAPPLRSRYEEEIRAAAAQAERNRLARDLHDSVRQQLFAIQASAATAEVRMEADHSGAKDALAQVRTAARDAMSEMEAMTDQLRAAPLENTGLLEALKRQCEALGHRTGAAVTFSTGRMPANEALAPGARQAIFRVAQEALSNVARHARAANVQVTLGADHGLLILDVRDDGRGFDRTQGTGGSGLENMRARAREVQADIAVESHEGAGTHVRFALPYATADPADYRRKMFWTGLAVILFAGFWVIDPRGRFEFYFLWTVPLFEFVRYTVAWRRARRLEGLAA